MRIFRDTDNVILQLEHNIENLDRVIRRAKNLLNDYANKANLDSSTRLDIEREVRMAGGVGYLRECMTRNQGIRVGFHEAIDCLRAIDAAKYDTLVGNEV